MRRPDGRVTFRETGAVAARVAMEDPFAAAGERIAIAGVLLDTAGLVTDCLALAAPDVHARTLRITSLVASMAEVLGLEDRWEFEVAARLSQIGCLSLTPEERRALAGSDAPEETERAFVSHPLVGRDLLARVRRLETVREMIVRQREPYTLDPDSTVPALDRVAVGAQLLHVAVDAGALLSAGTRPEALASALAARAGEYDPLVLSALADVLAVPAAA